MKRNSTKRKTVNIRNKNISKIIDEMLDGNIVELENGNVSKKICHRFSELRKRGLLYNAYDQRKKCSYLWFDESVDENVLRKRSSSVFGDIWEMVFG